MFNTVKNYFFLFKYVSRYTNFVWWCAVDGFIWGLYRSFTSVVFIKYLFDWIEQGKPFGQIMMIVAAMGLYMTLIYVFHENFYNFVQPRTQQQLHEKMHSTLFAKAKEMDLSCYDDPKFYNEYVWMLNQFEKEVMDVAFDISKFINRILSSAIIISLVATIDLTVVFAIVFAVAVSVMLKYIRTKLVFEKQSELKQYERKAEYIKRVFYLSEYAEEMRLSNISDVLNRDFDEAINAQTEIDLRYGKKLFAFGILRDMSSSTLINVGIITLLVYKIMVEKSISLGDFAASVSGTWTLFWQLNNLLEYFTKLKGHSLYAERLKKFLGHIPTVKDSENASDVPKFESLTLNKLCFSYPNTEKKALDGIDLKINRGEKIALVGYNGAGKSSLIKLILRLHDPTEGNILWNGINIKGLKIKEYHSQFGTVFQDYQIFAVSLAENVKADTVKETDNEKIVLSLNKSGFGDKLESLEKGIYSEVTKEFDKNGVNLSGGERQKLAIARAFMKDADIIILDEPSSALDPMSEYELNRTMMAAACDKTVIFISHRLSTTLMADKIYMLEDGKLIEYGSHDELIVKNKKYAEMFRVQAEKYQQEFSYQN